MRFRRDREETRDRSGPRPAPRVDVGSATAVGGRADNQDRGHVEAGLAVVSDGMGGHRGGALAAQLSVDAVVGFAAVPDREPAAWLVAAFDRANAAVRAARVADPTVGDMGATLTAAIPVTAIADASTWLVGHVGDSRALVVRADEAVAVTVDHNRAAELVAAGVISEERAAAHPGRHLLVRAIGPDPTVDVDLVEVVLGVDDALVLASDGLSGPIETAEIATIVRSADSAALAATNLVEVAVARGATDNVTVVVVRQLPSSTA